MSGRENRTLSFVFMGKGFDVSMKIPPREIFRM
jgi:hypothetical protein